MHGAFDGLGRFAEPWLLVLTSLADGPKHGYAIMVDIAAFSGVRMEPGTLYGALSCWSGEAGSGRWPPPGAAGMRSPPSGRTRQAARVLPGQPAAATAVDKLNAPHATMEFSSRM